jgi:hypothetical protein
VSRSLHKAEQIVVSGGSPWAHDPDGSEDLTGERKDLGDPTTAHPQLAAGQSLIQSVTMLPVPVSQRRRQILSGTGRMMKNPRSSA